MLLRGKTVRGHKAVIALAVAAAALLVGCRYDGTGTKMQWAPDMADSPAPKPQRTFLPPPSESVPMHAVFYAKDHAESEKTLVMPDWIANDPNAAETGKVMFETFCAVCHGIDAKGGGSLGPNYPIPPNLTHEAYKARGDGFFFHTVTFGSQSTLMPGYGYAISLHERWMIVKHLRTLQAAAQ